jgi:hypothetical protein
LYLYVETRWRPYECDTCSNDESTIFNKGVSIIMNFNLMDIYIRKKHGSHINTLKKIKSMIHSRQFILFFGKFLAL